MLIYTTDAILDVQSSPVVVQSQGYGTQDAVTGWCRVVVEPSHESC